MPRGVTHQRSALCRTCAHTCPPASPSLPSSSAATAFPGRLAVSPSPQGPSPVDRRAASVHPPPAQQPREDSLSHLFQGTFIAAQLVLQAGSLLRTHGRAVSRTFRGTGIAQAATPSSLPSSSSFPQSQDELRSPSLVRGAARMRCHAGIDQQSALPPRRALFLRDLSAAHLRTRGSSRAQVE